MSPRNSQRTRHGFTFLEVEVAFVLLGIGLAGLCPLVVMQLRLSRVLARANIQAGEPYGLNVLPKKGGGVVSPMTPYLSPHPFDAANPDRTFYLVPEANAWYRRFGFAASLQTDTPPAAPSPAPSPSTYDVTFANPPLFDGDNVTLYVSIVKRSAETAP